MIFITGDTRAYKTIEQLSQYEWGRMFIYQPPTPYKGERWGFDNGAYTEWLRGVEFNAEKYLWRLERAYRIGVPYIAIVPDLITQGLKSLEYSQEWLLKLPADWPWYLALQDGMKLKDVEPLIDKFTGLFLGGSNNFKATAWYWCKLAHKHGKKFHYGRAGTIKKIWHAKEVGSDSADSAFPLWTKERLILTQQILSTTNQQQSLWGAEVYALLP